MTVLEEAVDVGDSAVLHAMTEGQGRPLALCHGGPGDAADSLGPLAGMLVDATWVGRTTAGLRSRPFTVLRNR